MLQLKLPIPILGFVLLSLISSCGNRNLGTPTGLVIVPEKGAKINYGHSFLLRSFITYSSGKQKEVTGKKSVELSVNGGSVSGSIIYVENYPKSFKNDSIYISAKYLKKEVSFATAKVIPFNYLGDLVLEFNGLDGQKGEAGSKGRTALLFRGGKDGFEGEAGYSGDNGHDLSVHIYKDALSGLYFVRVMDVTTSEIYYYKNKDTGFPIKFKLMGGAGGEGGKGGEGGDGKDAKKTEKKTKLCGAGGNGANGGIGGTGGNGGTVYVFIHPSADGIQKRITIYNTGGVSGPGGKGGAAGKAGAPLENGNPCKDGVSGGYGADGTMGLPGQAIQISVEDFDIDF
jgi:hypothetical protein